MVRGRIWKSGRAWWLELPTGRIVRAESFAEAFCQLTGVANG